MRQSGFTLLEMIVVIVLLGILGSTGAILVQKPIEAYRDVLTRQELVDQADNALRQLVRDVRQALPNSLRIVSVGSSWALEMANTVDGSRYRDQTGGGYTGAETVLSFTAASDDSFNILGKFAYTKLLANERLVIYNTSASIFYSEAAANASSGVITPSTTSLTLLTKSKNGVQENQIQMNPAFKFSQRSPTQRLFVVDGPISYLCDSTTHELRRFDGYSFTASQPASASNAPLNAASQQLMATEVLNCEIDYQAGSSQRSDTLRVGITLQDTATAEQIRLFHQVHVQNVP